MVDITLLGVKAAFLKAGWTLGHTSKASGRVTSYYFLHPATPAGIHPIDRKKWTVRVSDHELSAKAFSDRVQDGGACEDFIVDDYWPETNLADFPKAADDYICGDQEFCEAFKFNGGVVEWA